MKPNTFHTDPSWLGTGGVTAIQLSNEKVLWLTSEAFIKEPHKQARSLEGLVHNSIAIQSGIDFNAATATFHWKTTPSGDNTSFFAHSEKSDNHEKNKTAWYWPWSGIRLDEGPVVIFLLSIIRKEHEEAIALGFAIKGFALALISNPDAPVDQWEMTITEQPAVHSTFIPATTLIEQGDYLIALAVSYSSYSGKHPGILIRYLKKDLAVGKTQNAEWWTGKETGWSSIKNANLQPEIIMEDARSENSIHFDATTQTYIHIASYGFLYPYHGIGMRTAKEITGPWSEETIIYRPQEADLDDVRVYGTKAHPLFSVNNSNALFISYATNTGDFSRLLTPPYKDQLFWPRFIHYSLVNHD